MALCNILSVCVGGGRGQGSGVNNLPLPLPLTPSSYPFHSGYRILVLFLLQNIIYCCTTFSRSPGFHFLGNPASHPFLSHLPHLPTPYFPLACIDRIAKNTQRFKYCSNKFLGKLKKVYLHTHILFRDLSTYFSLGNVLV